MSLEDFGEMTLIGEAGGECDFAERHITGGNLARGKIESQPAQVLADCATILLAKYASQMHRMNPDSFGDIIETKRLGEVIVKEIFRSAEPTRRGWFAAGAKARRLSKNFEEQAFHRQ